MPTLRRVLTMTAACAIGATALIATPATAFAEPAGTAAPGIHINEVESSGGVPGDWVEFTNTASTAVTLDGWIVRDNKDDSAYTFPVGTTVEPGAFLVVEEDALGFGLGKEDSVRLFDQALNLTDEYSWTAHADITYGVLADRSGWGQTTESTKGAANAFSTPEVPDAPGEIRINEIDSQPFDWVEFFNPGTAALDISGYEIRDNSDDHRWQFLPGTSIAPGEFLVVEESTIGLSGGSEVAFRDPIGIGSADEIRLFDASGTLLDRSGTWSGHAAIDGDFISATLARCPDGEGAFTLARITKGAANDCVLPNVAINEVESDGDATDWVEIVNLEPTAVDLSGWTLMDNDPVGHADQTTPLPAGTILEPGAYFVFDQNVNFVFGLGNGDTTTVRNASGATVAEYTYAAHAEGVLARCPDGTGEFVDTAVSTKGLRNACGNPVRINEVESDGGSPDDWVELVNPTASTLDVSGIVVKDDDDTHAYTIPAGTTIPSAGYLVIERDQLGFGLGGGDTVRLFEGDSLLDSTTWGEGHAATTWGRCPDITGTFAVTAESTKGAANLCAGEIPVGAWPGSPDVTVIDDAPMFLEDSSGLDTQVTDEGAFLWAVDNGTGSFWKLAIAADGSISFADGWEDGKRARFQKDASNPSAAGPDTEGITVDGDGAVYLGVERDNSVKGETFNAVLKMDPNAAGPDVVASQEWDLTALLPTVGANLGVEAVEWVADGDLAGKLFDDSTKTTYDPADYAGHGDGLFFVGVEDTGGVYAFALNADGSAQLVSTIDPGLPAVMALDYDTTLGVLWAMCDDGCAGTGAQITLNGTSQPGAAHVARPAGLPDINNEGFATLPASQSIDGQRAAFWFADGFASQALRQGSLPGASVTPPTGGVTPLPESALNDENRGTITVPKSAKPGETITVGLGVSGAGADVEVWLYSTPVRIAAGTTDASGNTAATIPADATLGAHRIVVYAADGTLLGWAELDIVAAAGAGDGGAGAGSSAGGALATTGTESPTGTIAAGVLLLMLGAALLVARARRRAV
ncbi:MAG TPA: lamin tail domain-containing protein [Plantibacter sp.]|uniref:lamin tail domain-containing protein n=1 Tax=unclassified Plantibacter TaxID=2624265 RepID=UPI002C9FB240|nr:lamin tail domain-containing protein [Plantibacter sp.]